MQCPKCKELTAILELNEIEIDSCFSCGGVWLDGGELEQLLGASAESAALLAGARAVVGREKTIRCPRCGRKMKKRAFHEDIITDACPRGHGIWFDDGELQKIVALIPRIGENPALGILKEIFRFDHKA